MTEQGKQFGQVKTEVIEFHSFVPEVLFDLQEVVVEGVYPDELSAYRAKRAWVKALASSFLLDDQYDFHLRVSRDERGAFVVRCAFDTACGRYAFWRLTHNQAPEIRQLLRIAHIPGTAENSAAATGAYTGVFGRLFGKLKRYFFS